ncbi:LysR family transcriptional regulator [Roseateles sp. BYS180W]|uniref:LysR family transcriptional regulator n=1 Tax=Roseateles rivi TaxID=3299028 RepID=A0ABW7FVM3_9BURK
MTLDAPLRLPSLDALRAFEAAARLGSLEHAAQTLHITPSAVGKRIAALEQQLGLTLLERPAKPLRLSASGREYLEQVRSALALLAAVPLHRPARLRRTRVTLSAPPTLARQVLVAGLPELARQAPEVELELVLSSPYAQHSALPCDLEVCQAPDDLSQAPVWQQLLHGSVTPMASPALLQRHGPLRHAADLAGLPLLCSPLQPWAPWLAAAGLDWAEPEQGPRLVDLGLALEAAAQGQGVVLGQTLLAAPLLRQGLLQPLFDLSVPALRAYGLRAHRDTPASRAVVQWLQRHCQSVAEISSGSASPRFPPSS